MSRYTPRNKPTVSLEDNNIQAEPTAPVEGEVDNPTNFKAHDDALQTTVALSDDSESPESLSKHVQVELHKVAEGETEIENALKAAENVVTTSLEAMSIYDPTVNKHATGKMNRTEAMLLSLCMDLSSKTTGVDTNIDMPSLECFDGGMAYGSTEVSLEGLQEKIDTVFNNINLSIEKSILNGIGLAKSFTPLIGRLRTRAQTALRNVNDSNREAGMKEVSGSFAKKLSVDGRSGEAKTILKAADSLATVTAEILDESKADKVVEFVKQSQRGLMSGLDLDDEKFQRSPLYLLLFFFGNLGGGTAMVIADNLASQVKVTPDVMPDLTSIYTNTAKHNYVIDSPKGGKTLDAKRSDNLFGGKVVSISKYKPTIDVRLNNTTVPSIKLITINDTVADGKCQALTSKEQREALTKAIIMLDAAESYWKGYATRNEARKKTYQEAFKTITSLRREARAFGGARKIFTVAVLDNYPNYITWLFWRGVVKSQKDIAVYAKDCASALIDYAIASTAATQAD